MTQFSVCVITPNGLAEEAEALLAPFCENLEVPEWEKHCWCVGLQAKARAHQKAAQKMPIEIARRTFLERADVKQLVQISKEASNYGFSSSFDNLWREEFEQPFLILCAEILATEHGLNEPNPTCPDCLGAGTILTTENPQAKWDDYDFSGIWVANFQHLQGVTTEEFLQQASRTFAIITPDGTWLEKGELIYFSMIEGPGQWEEIFQETLKKFANHRILVYNCHV
jgi:hypothetical protein